MSTNIIAIVNIKGGVHHDDQLSIKTVSVIIK